MILSRRKYLNIAMLMVFLLSSTLALFNFKAADAYTYNDYSLTTEAECTAAGGTINSAYQGSEMTTFCSITSSSADQASLILNAAWLADCMYQDIWIGGNVNTADGKFFSVDATDIFGFGYPTNNAVGHMLEPDDGIWGCDEGDNAKTAASLLGYSSMAAVLLDLGCTEFTGYENNPGYICKQMTDRDGAVTTSFSQQHIYFQLLNNKYEGIELDERMKYYIALNTFISGCKATRIENPTSSDYLRLRGEDGYTYSLQVLGPDTTDPTMVDALYTAELASERDITTINEVSGWEDGRFWCSDLAAKVNQYADFYLSWAGNNITQAAIDAGTTPSGTIAPEDGAATSTTSCNIEGAGWIVCPIATLFAKMNDGMFNLLKIMFIVPPLTLDTSSENATYSAWAQVRNLANVAFVIVFLIIIFSQVTSMGIGNYGIKKMIPRLLIAVVFVNLSYWICAIAVDVSNILGQGVHDALGAMRSQANVQASWEMVIGALLGGGTLVASAGVVGVLAAGAASSAGMGVLWLALPALVGALIAIVAAVAVIAMRQAIIIIFIIISPLAFVAYLLPNTEKYFKKWWDILLRMLMLFPVFAFIYGGSQLASYVLLGVAGDVSTNAFANGQIDNAAYSGLMVILAMFVGAAPLFSLPFLVKSSGSMLNGLGSKIKGLGSGIKSATGQYGKGRFDLAKKEGLVSNANGGGIGNFMRRQGQTRERNDRRRGLRGQIADSTKRRSDIGDLADDNGITSGLGSSPALEEIKAKAQDEELRVATQAFEAEYAKQEVSTAPGKPSMDDFLISRANDTSRTLAERHAAVHRAAKLGRDNVLRTLARTGDEGTKTAVREAVSANVGALLAKSPDVVKGEKAAFNSLRGAALAMFSSGTAKTHMEYLQRLHTEANDTTRSAAQRAESQADLDEAASVFNGAIQDITQDSTLQGNFGADTGTVFLRELNGSSAEFQAFASAHLGSMAGIQSDGKIR